MNRYTMPTFAITAAGDEFTLPDSPRWWWDQLPGEKHLRIIPNAQHTLVTAITEVLNDLKTFYKLIHYNISRPDFTWTLDYVKTKDTAAKTVVTLGKDKPKSVRMWWADTVASSGKRDFRLVICFDLSKPECIQPILWFPVELQLNNGPYTAEMSDPAAGWSGFMVQIDYEVKLPSGKTVQFTTTSEVNIVPDIFPFPRCPENLCNSPPALPPQA